MKVAVCEDERGILELVEFIVNEMGHVTIKCATSDELITMLKNNSVDLVILDYWLKEGRADKIIAKIHSEFAGVPIILMSAVSELPELSKKLKTEGYIKKPFDIDDFKLKISSIFNDSKHSNS